MENNFYLFNEKRTILIVEDEEINREILINMLKENYNLLCAEDGEEALNIIKEKRDYISLILLDLQIPKINGIEVLERLHSNDELSAIPVIVITSDNEQEIKCLTLGASDFISKPYPPVGIILARAKRIIDLYENKKIIDYTQRDSLTNLYTKEYFYKYTIDYDMFDKDKKMDAIIVGIRSFYIIKERFGIDYSNEILIRFAKRLRQTMPKITGMVCRKEADMFMIYCSHLDNYNDLLDDLSKDFYVDKNNEILIKLQMGVYANVNKTIDIDMRFERAKMALDKIKNNIVNNISLFDDSLKEKEVFDEELIEEFPKALKEKQFKVYYQPKYNIKGERPVLASAEALIRWEHPKLGLISPAVFIPLFEQNGMIQMIDMYVWEEVGKQIKKWKEDIGFYVPVSVNVSRIDLYDPELTTILKNIVINNQLDFKDLLLEITESACTDEPDAIINKIIELRNEGFKIEMDDFGTGYSSLSMISNMPIDALKLDMVFIRKMFESQNDNKMLQIILDIASFLKVPTIAEGVESVEQVNALKQLGCDIIQGYYFSKPIPVEEFNDFLINKRIL